MALFGFDEQYAMFDVTPVANQFLLEYMPMAKGDYVKVYLYGLMQCHHPQADASVEQLGRELNMSGEDVLAAYRYWERKGLVRRVSDNPPSFRYVSVSRQSLLGGAETADDAYEAFAEAVYGLFGNDRRLHGKELSQCYEWVEQMGLPQEVVLTLLRHMISQKGKRFSMAAAEKLAVELCEAGVRTPEDAELVLNRDKQVLEGSRAVLREFTLFRDPTQAEMALYRKWTAEWGFSPEAVIAACADTTNGKQPSFKYLDSILKNKKDEMGLSAISARQVTHAQKQRDNAEAPLRALLRALNLPGVTVNPSTLAEYGSMRELYDDDIILLAGQECAKQGCQFADVLQMLKAWKKKNLETAEQIRAYMSEVGLYVDFVKELKALWGKPSRSSAADRALAQKWLESWGLSRELVIACAAYAAGAEKPMPYLDKLLERMRQQGVTTPDQAAAAQRAWQESQAAAPAQKPGKTVREQQYTQREYEDTDEMPEWMRKRWEEMNGGAK